MPALVEQPQQLRKLAHGKCVARGHLAAYPLQFGPNLGRDAREAEGLQVAMNQRKDLVSRGPIQNQGPAKPSRQKTARPVLNLRSEGPSCQQQQEFIFGRKPASF